MRKAGSLELQFVTALLKTDPLTAIGICSQGIQAETKEGAQQCTGLNLSSRLAMGLSKARSCDIWRDAWWRQQLLIPASTGLPVLQRG